MRPASRARISALVPGARGVRPRNHAAGREEKGSTSRWCCAVGIAGECGLAIAEAIARTKAGGSSWWPAARRTASAACESGSPARWQWHPQTPAPPPPGQMPKYHGVVFWLRHAAEAGASRGAAKRCGNRQLLMTAASSSAPGMFSSDRIDAGSRLLARGPACRPICPGGGFLRRMGLSRRGTCPALSGGLRDGPLRGRFRLLRGRQRNLADAMHQPTASGMIFSPSQFLTATMPSS